MNAKNNFFEPKNALLFIIAKIKYFKLEYMKK